MPSLSFEPGKKSDSTPIALVNGGDYNGDYLYLVNEEGSTRRAPKVELNLTEAEQLLRHMSPKDRHAELLRMEEAFNSGQKPTDYVGKGKDAYEVCFLKATKNSEKKLELPPECSFTLLPTADKAKRDVWFIAGPSGAGKSYIAKTLAEKYRKQFPDRPIYLVSKLPSDETLDSMKGGKPIRINVQKLVDSPIKELEPLRDSLVLFDDYDTYTAPFDKAVFKLIDDIATMGRHTNTSMLCMSHYLTNYKKTRLLLTEATHYVIYPNTTGRQALSYFLKTYVGMDDDEISELKRMGSRWICIHKNYPMWLVSEHSAKLLHLE